MYVNFLGLRFLSDSRLLGSKPFFTPLPKGLRFVPNQGDPLLDPDRYIRLIDRLLYLNFTRPDDLCWNAALHVLRYVKGCPSKGLYFPVSNNLQHVAYYDAGWASCPESMRSLTGFCVSLGGELADK